VVSATRTGKPSGRAPSSSVSPWGPDCCRSCGSTLLHGFRRSGHDQFHPIHHLHQAPDGPGQLDADHTGLLPKPFTERFGFGQYLGQQAKRTVAPA